MSGSNATIANSTFYLGRTGPSNSVQTDTGASATASVYNVLAVGPETDFFENTAGGLSLYNCISTDASASTYDVSGSFKIGVDELTEFISLAGTINLHLRAGAEAIDFGADRSASFGDDIDDETRPFGSGWDVGADESPYPSATTNYRSIGTAASYGVGTVNVTNLSDSVTGVGTAWLTNNRGRGDVITIPCPDPPACIAGVDYTIRAVTADASLRLTELYSGTTGSETYLIRRQFTTLQAWEDCISFAVSPCPYFPVSSADLVADDRREIGIAYEDSAFTSAGGVPIVRFQGSTTDEFHDITLTADWFNRHFGIAGGAGNNVVLDMGAEAGSNGVRIQDDFITVEWLELTGGTAMDGFEVSGQSSPSQVTLRYNLIHDTASGDGMQLRDADLSVDVYNNIFYGVNKAIELNVAVPTSARILNNTIYNCNEGVFADDRVSGCNNCKFDTVLLQNNIAHTFSGVAAYSVPSTSSTGFATDASSNNLASDAIGTTHSAAGGGLNGVAYASMNFVSATDLHITSGSAAEDQAVDLSGSFIGDIDSGLRSVPWDIGADDILATTAVELVSFSARGLEGSVELSWETASELNNLGFHLYRSTSEDGSYERITATAIPGLGSSPVGTSYSYKDSGLTNGVTYYYKLEDIETTGKTELHGPVSATPAPTASGSGGESGSSTRSSSQSSSPSLITYGDPSGNSLRILKRSSRQLVLELVTEGFYAEPQEDGSVRLEVPGFESLIELAGPGIPVKRTWVDAVAGRKVKLVSVQARGVEAFTSLRPSDAETPEIVATQDGTVRAARRRSRRRVTPRARAAFQGGGLYPSEAARVVSVGFQGDVKKALLELSPLRWDASTGQLLLARRLVVRLSFRGRDLSERSTDGVRGRRYRRRRSHERRGVVARLATTERGLHAVRYEEVLGGGRGVRASALRLSRQGQAASFHLEPNSNRFKPGSILYFVSEGASSNPYGSEAVYELEASGEGGESMPEISGAPSGEPTRFYWHRAEWEEDRYYQAALLEAPDLWLWDLLFAPVVKSYPFEVSSLAPSGEASTLSVWLQGVSDFTANPDHHVRVYVNGTLVAEVSWDGKRANKIDVDLWPGLLQEGDNVLELENVGDTEATYSMVMLDRYALEYPRVALTDDGRLRGRFRASGAAELSGFVTGAHVLDVTEGDAQPSWLLDTEVGFDGMLRFRVESGRSYLAVSPEAVYHPSVTMPRASRLKNVRSRADYLVIGPEAFLRAAIPLLELRRSEGLKVKAVSIEEVYSEFGFGEPTPEAVKDFLSYAYHNWKQPSPRYVLLLGDATFDFKDHLQTGVTNQVPPRMVKTSYLWTASDPSYAAVNGEDILPDFSIGRLPAATVDEVQAMVEKIVAYETGEAGLHRSAVVLVADNPDRAGNFEADADALAATVLASKHPEKIYLSRLGTAAMRNAIVQSFDEGASLMSYLGHGGIHLWASENFFNRRDVASLGPQPQQPILLTMNCLNGYFHFPYFNALAEELVQAKDKGAIAAFSPSGLSLNGPANLYHEALLQELFNGNHERLGDAVLAAQERYAASGAFPELLSIYHLLGDPALKVR